MGKVVYMYPTLRKALIRSYIYRKAGHILCADGEWIGVTKCEFYADASQKASELLNDFGGNDPDDGERVPKAA